MSDPAATSSNIPDSTSPALSALTLRLQTLELTLNAVRPQLPSDDWYADAAVLAKAVQWALRDLKLNDATAIPAAEEALLRGETRAAELVAWVANTAFIPSYLQTPGALVLGYVSRIDQSVQPYRVTLPTDSSIQPIIASRDPQRYPLHVVLHGRDDSLTELKFVSQLASEQTVTPRPGLRLDVFGRGNNAYRWGGETDVYEAIAAVSRRWRIDQSRIALEGFSMGGAGAWQLGLQRPSFWCSVSAGAGFVDTAHQLKLTEPLQPPATQLTRIYDAIGYIENAANVPLVAYAGETDRQRHAGDTMHTAATGLGISLPLLIGPGTGHAVHPESAQEIRAFHASNIERGRPSYPQPRSLRFTTYTLKYHQCDWLTLHEQITPYELSRVEANVDESTSTLRVTTSNVAALQIARDVCEFIQLDGGEVMPLSAAAEGLLPGVDFTLSSAGWKSLSHLESIKFAQNPDGRKRHNLQGPIDDAFMEPFVCVIGSQPPWSTAHQRWSDWTLARFRDEYRRYLHADLMVVIDTQLDEAILATHNLILFGDPGSNTVLARLADRLPIGWTAAGITIGNETYSADQTAVPLICPNPLAPHRYLVLNSGHTFHAAEFQASNASLYPRLGDLAVLDFAEAAGEQGTPSFTETVRQNHLLGSDWRWAGSPTPQP